MKPSYDRYRHDDDASTLFRGNKLARGLLVEPRCGGTGRVHREGTNKKRKVFDELKKNIDHSLSVWLIFPSFSSSHF